MKDVEAHNLEDNNVKPPIGSKSIQHYTRKESGMDKPDEPTALHNNPWCAFAGLISDKFHPEIAQSRVLKIEFENIDTVICQIYSFDSSSHSGENYPSEYRHNSLFNEYTIEQIRKNPKFDKKEKRYSVGLPWKQGYEKTRQVLDPTDLQSYAFNQIHSLKRYGLKIFIAILLYFYLDDFLSSVKDTNRAKEIKEKLSEALTIEVLALTKQENSFLKLYDLTQPSPLSQQTRLESSVEQMENGEADRSELPRSCQPPIENPLKLQDSDDKDHDPTVGELSEKINNSFATGEGIMEEFIKNLENKILRAGFSYKNYTFYVRVREKLFKSVNNKSQLLNWIASIYETLRFVGLYVLLGKILIQELQQFKLGCKYPVPKNFKKELRKGKNVPQFRKLTIPHWTKSLTVENSVSTLITFCDASAIGHEAVTYVRKNVRRNKSNSLVSFLFSKVMWYQQMSC